MSHLETQETEMQTEAQIQVQAQLAPLSSAAVRSICPDCNASLVVLRVIGGRAGCEYWTMRCTHCGGIHLDIVDASPDPIVA